MKSIVPSFEKRYTAKNYEQEDFQFYLVNWLYSGLKGFARLFIFYGVSKKSEIRMVNVFLMAILSNNIDKS